MLLTPQSSKSLTNLSTNALNVSTSPLSIAATGLTEPLLHRSITAVSNASTNLVAETGIIIVGGSPTIATEVTSLVSTNSNLVNRSNDIVSLVRDPLPTQKSKFKDRVTLENPLNNELRYLLDPTADNTIATAYNLGKLDGKMGTRSSAISGSDLVDYTHVHLDQTSSFNLFLKGAIGNAAVDLLNASGTTIASSDDGTWYRLAQGISTTQNFDTHDVALNLSSLAAGDYYLKVSPVWSQQRSTKPFDRVYLPTTVPTDYDLTVSTTPVSNLLPTEIDLGTLSGTRLLKGSLDSNNTSEMYRVTVGAGNLHITLSGMNANADVRLIKDYNNDGVVNANEVIASSAQGYGFTDGTHNTVRGGTYFIQVSQGQGGYGAATNYDLGISTGDWYTNNLSDYGVIAQARLAGANSWIDRNEMISLLRGTEDGGIIDATELSDLRTVLSGLGHAMPDFVSNLANKVLNGDPANTRIGGSNIGNLGAIDNGNLFGSDSSQRMESLIGKWFLGNDRPAADITTTYQRANGSLFQNGISWQDVDQGAVGDCYFMAGLAAVARTDHTIIDNMITDNGDDTFTVRFFNSGKADYVTVDRFLPTTKENSFFYANNSSGKRFDNNTNELWVALVEKAYAQVNESGWLGRDNTNSYIGTASGFASNALSLITGRSSEGNRHVSSGTWIWRKDDIGYIINAFNTNKPVVFGGSNDDDSRIVPKHEYTLVDYNAATGMFTLFNPWGVNGGKKDGQFKPGTVSLSKDEVINSFNLWYTTV